MKYYIYRHVRLDKNQPFYIGIGTKNNDDLKYNTYTRANSTQRRNNIWKKITNKTEYIVEILYESDNYEFIKEKEKEFIKLYGRIDLKKGILSNMTDGGEGTINIIVSEEARKLRSIFQKGRKKSIESINKRNLTIKQKGGFIHSKESLRKISLGKSKPVIQYSLKGEFIKLWNTTVEAAEFLNIPRSSICQCANINELQIYTAYNFIWIYLEDFSKNNVDKFNTALDKVKQGKIKKVISLKEKTQIKEEYSKIYNNFIKKKDKIEYLSEKYKINFSTIRAILNK